MGSRGNDCVDAGAKVLPGIPLGAQPALTRKPGNTAANMTPLAMDCNL